MTDRKDNSKVEFSTDWAKNAEDAAKKAEEQVNKIKKDAREQLSESNASYNNPDDTNNK